MSRYPVVALLLIASVRFAPAVESAPLPQPPETETPARGELHRVALAGRQDGLEELARAMTLTVYFRTGSMDVDGEILSRIRLLGGLLQDFPGLNVYLDAHSDRRGSNAHNRRLSRARADMIAGLLRDAGIPAHRIHGNAWGETQARALNDDAEGLIFDRRVDIQLSVDPGA